MGKQLMKADDVKKVLGIDSFRNITKDQVIELVSLIPAMETEVATAIINQLPAYADMAGIMIKELNILCDKALVEAHGSHKESIEAYKLILADLSEALKKENISPEERASITADMILVADKIAEKDSEWKHFLFELVKTGGTLMAGALVLGVAVLTGKTGDIKLPFLKK